MRTSICNINVYTTAADIGSTRTNLNIQTEQLEGGPNARETNKMNETQVTRYTQYMINSCTLPDGRCCEHTP